MIPDLIHVFKTYHKNGTASFTYDDKLRLTDVRYLINKSTTNISCGTCVRAMLDDINTFLKVRGYYEH